MAFRYLDTLRERPVRLPGGSRPLTMYVCGPTVYAPAHVGHARTYLYFDLIRRYFADAHVPVRHLLNITDVEDKIDQRAQELHTHPLTLARREERRFFSDLARLNVLPPTYAPRASEFVGGMVRVARKLERTGRVRPIGNGWFFRPPKRRGHGNFVVAREIDRHMVFETNGALGPRLDPRDFLVWRRQRSPRLSFQSPWGPGVPGWHLECYAMAERYLGVPVDLQGGGADLVFPHHYAQNEVSLALTGRPFARGFLHTGFVLLGGRKMSKSVGNLVDLSDALTDLGASPLRWFLLSAPRSSPIEWTTQAVQRARQEFLRVRATLATTLAPGIGSGRAADLEELANAMRRDIADDLRAHRAFRRLAAWADRARRAAQPRLRRGERGHARRAVGQVERLTGLELLPRVS